jgi:hypothetical protein
MYRHELSDTSEPERLSLDNKWKRMEEAVGKVATNTIGYTRKQVRKEWFDEECEKVNEDKKACRANAIQRKREQEKNKYNQARPKEMNLFKEKSRQLDDEALIKIGSHMEAFRTRVDSTCD